MTTPENISDKPLESIAEIRKRARQNRAKMKEGNVKGQGQNMKNSYSGLRIVQTDRAIYAIYLPTGQQIGVLALPPNGQYIKDAQALAEICRPLASRWANP